MTTNHAEAVAILKQYVADKYDGSIEANFWLDKLLWTVRLAHPNNHPEPKMRQPE
jgi:hypothetical protein